MIELSNVTIRTGDYILRDLSLRIESGCYAVITGKTGIGKTTILEAICGLRPIQVGSILLDGIDVSDWGPADRNLGYVPQDLALFPTFSVRQHLEFAMRIRHVPADERHRHALQLAERLGIAALMDRRIAGLSGGEAQRVALGRALAFRPSALLLDEPLSALDSDTRVATQELLRNLNRELAMTIVHVTHNQEEADVLGQQRIHLMHDESSKQVTLSTKGA